MRKYLLIALMFLLLPCAVKAQTPGTVQFPTALDSEDSLFRVSDLARAKLTANIDTAATTLTVDNANSFPISGSMMVDNEIIYYTSRSGNQFSGLIRGQSGSQLAAHVAGVYVRGVILGVHHNTVVKSLINTQGKLGFGSVNQVPEDGTVLVGTGGGRSEWKKEIQAKALLGYNLTLPGTVTAGNFVGSVPNASLPTSPNFSGTVTATSFVGNGAGLTGIGTGTGGVINTGSTTIGADSGSTGTGVIDLQTKATTRLRINNDGSARFYGTVGGAFQDQGGFAFNVKSPLFGARCDTQETATVTTTTNSPVVSSSANIWVAADQNKNIVIALAGVGGDALAGTILTVNAANNITVSVNASSSGANRTAMWGTNDTVPIQTANTAAQGVLGGTVEIPSGVCLMTAPLDLKSSTTLKGTGQGRPGDSFGSPASGSSTLFLGVPVNSLLTIGEHVTDVVIDGVNLRSLSQNQTIGIAASGEAPNSSFDFDFHNFHVRGFDKGISVEGGTLQWQMDRVSVRDYYSDGNTYGIYFNSQNADNWTIANSKIQATVGGYGIYAERVGQLKVSNLQVVANTGGNGAAFLYLTGSHGNVNVDSSAVENIDYFIDTSASAGGNSTYPITLVNNFIQAIRLRHSENLVSIGNTYWVAQGVAAEGSANDVRVWSFGDSVSDQATTAQVPATPFALIGNGTVTEFGNFRNRIDNSSLGGTQIVNHLGVGTASVGTDAVVKAQITASESTAQTPFIKMMSPDPAVYYGVSRNPTTGYLQNTGSQTGYVGWTYNGHILPSADNQFTLGNGTYRWSLIRGTTITSGDLLLTNKVTGEELYKIHEDQDNIIFDDARTGVNLMRLDRRGNLYLKGRVIQGQQKRKRVRRARRWRAAHN